MAEAYSHQTVLNVQKVEKATQGVSNSDEKCDIANGSRAFQRIEEIDEESFSDNCDEEDIRTKKVSFGLGAPQTMWIEEHLLETGDGNLDSKADECLFLSVDEKDRTESIKSIKSISLILTPKEKSIEIFEDTSRISLRLNEKLILTQRDPKDYYHIDKKVLGKGTFGKVRRAVRIGKKEEVAIKKIRKNKLDTTNRALLENEIRILREIKHESIVCLHEVLETKKHIFLIMELCSGGDAFDLVDKEKYLSEEEAAGLTQQIVAAVDYIHGRGVVHRDLKLENILIVDWKLVSKTASVRIKIADFGFATTFKPPNALIEGTCGSLNYVAPEVLTGRPYTKACDLWSIGVILYAMLAGYLPFYDKDIGGRAKTFQKIQNGIYDFKKPVWRGVSESARSVIKGLLQVKVDERLKCNDLGKHRWIRYYCDIAKKSVC